MPFDVATRDGLLVLTLDTPRSAVNIFNHATARQLIEILTDLSPATTRAIVFETAKPGSFLNGVGLLLAQAAQTYADVERASTLPWTAYRAVREAPVPTIAVIQGNCFGCGVEFALGCDYRIASDTAETRFYMTELNDYLFIPLFGGTWNLPATVGLENAIDLLLWGARWDAETAHARGLVDEVTSHADLARRRAELVDRVLAGTQPRPRRGGHWSAAEDGAVERARGRIAALPAIYRGVYTDALDLLEAGARQRTTYAEHQRNELRASAASALAPIGKAAYAFFYLRQIASERAAERRRGDGEPITLAADLDGDQGARDFVHDLGRRNLTGVAFVHRDRADVRLVSPEREAGNGSGIGVAVQVTVAARPAADVSLYAPGYRSGARLIELATRPGADLQSDIPRLARTLQRFGFEVARTRPSGGFVTNALLLAYLGPLVRAIELGEDPRTLNAALRGTGFIQLPGDLLARLDRAALAIEIGACLGRPAVEVERALASLTTSDCAAPASGTPVIDALCVSFLDAVLGARARGDIRDPTIADLIARELLDFPRHLCSLTSWLTVARVARSLEQDGAIRLLPHGAVVAARRFVAAGRELYR